MQLRDTAVYEVFKVSEIDHVANVAVGGIQLVEKMQIQQPTWYFIYLLLLIGLFAWIRLYYGNMVIQTLQASTNFQVAIRMFNDNGLLKNQLDTILSLFYLLSMSFLLYYLELKSGLRPYDLEGGLLCLFNITVLGGIFLSRFLLVNLAGILFNRQKIIREYLYNIFIYNKLSGMAALPLIFFLVYTRGTLQEVAFWITVFVLGAIIVMRIARGIVFSYRKEVLLFYLFLYLCALELAPLVLLYRWLEGIL